MAEKIDLEKIIIVLHLWGLNTPTLLTHTNQPNQGQILAHLLEKTCGVQLKNLGGNSSKIHEVKVKKD